MKREQSEPHKADILVVDDTPANLRLLSRMLVEHGFQVRPVPDGPLALAAARAKPPDLVLLDCAKSKLTLLTFVEFSTRSASHLSHCHQKQTNTKGEKYR